MEKHATGGVPGLTWDYLADKFVKYGLPAAAVGSGLAGLAHFISMGGRKAQDEKAKDNGDTIVIEVPTKTAGTSLGQYFWDAPTVAGAALAGGGIGYAVVDQILKKYRQKQLDDELSSLKKQYATYLAQDMAPKTATEYPVLDGLLLALTEIAKSSPVEPQRKEAAEGVLKKAFGDPTIGTMLTSLPGVAALLSGVLAHNYYYNRQKDIQRGLEKSEAEQMKLAPKNIKVVSVPQAPAKASKKQKKDDSVPVDDLLGKEGAEAPIPVSPAQLQSALQADEGGGKTVSVKKDVESKREDRRKAKIVSKEDLQQIDPNTLMLLTDSGNIQVDALDPAALAALEKHKDLILKSFALGMNTK